MKETILIIDDDSAIRKLLEVSLSAAGYHPVCIATGKEALNRAAIDAPALVLLDLGLPDMDGKEFLMHFREWSQAPVIVLSARSVESEKIAALEGGCDDYLTKPFGTGELLARIKAALRRSGRNIGDFSSALISNNLSMDIASHTVMLDNEELKLTPKEFDLLKVLMQNSGKVLTHAWLLKEIWGVGYQNETHYLRVFINQLRQKIEIDSARPKRIITETGIGYRFVG
ncbi:response regulator [Sulfuricurvum sp.]|uniref:response regulator n=1 Tax=Sulfuricurvum sp. TaxID=2025608 RepID=UPI00260B9550|nr:response regulator [Sulfuricurvum sp.]MDD2266969.1 response regulator [Sulfuricurvum sp.]MDD2784103.1 response regulator [Sulfuricurvum sp.]HZF69688.1 response regulator [Sulfuricurvum sp.]